MSIQCEYDGIVSPTFMGDVSKVIEVEASLKLPESYPKIYQIKGGYLRSGLPSITVDQDGVFISGTIAPYILYVAVEAEMAGFHQTSQQTTEDVQDGEFEENEIPSAALEYGFQWDGLQGVYFEERIPLAGLTPGMEVEVELKPLTADFERNSNHEVILRGQLELVVHAATVQASSVIRELLPLGRLNVQKERISVEEMLERKQGLLNLDPTLVLPSMKPGLSRILDYQLQIVAIDCQPVANKTHLQGFVEVMLVYVGSDDGGRPGGIFVNEWNREFGNAIPFHLVLDLENRERTVLLPKVTVVNNRLEPKSSRELQCRLEMVGEITKVQIVAKDIVVGVEAGPDEIVDTEKYLLNVEEFAGDLNGEIEVDLKAVIPDKLPSIDRILAYQAGLRQVRLEAAVDKVLMDGKLTLWLEYIADSEEPQQLEIAAWDSGNNNGLPLAGIVDFSGLGSDALLRSQMVLDRLSLELSGDREVHVKGTVKLNLVAKIPRAIMAVQNCALITPVNPATRPCMLFYLVQPGDTLWKIARYYQTTVDSLVHANKIVDPARIEAGQKLIIPKQIAGYNG